MDIELSDEERRVLSRLLAKRKALLIEIKEDTAQPNRARRGAITDLRSIASIGAKLGLWTGPKLDASKRAAAQATGQKERR